MPDRKQLIERLRRMADANEQDADQQAKIGHQYTAKDLRNIGDYCREAADFLEHDAAVLEGLRTDLKEQGRAAHRKLDELVEEINTARDERDQARELLEDLTSEGAIERFAEEFWNGKRPGFLPWKKITNKGGRRCDVKRALQAALQHAQEQVGGEDG